MVAAEKIINMKELKRRENKESVGARKGRTTMKRRKKRKSRFCGGSRGCTRKRRWNDSVGGGEGGGGEACSGESGS